MISERIVDFYTIQIRLFKQKMKRLGFLYAFSNLTLRSMNAGVYFYLALQHNTDYVFAADFGGLFQIMSRIFSMRRRCSVPVEMM